MKDLLAKSLVLIVVATLESSVGLPLMFLGIFLLWGDNDRSWFYSFWIIFAGVLLGVLWQFPLWLAILVMYLLDLSFKGMKGVVFSKLLRCFAVVTPFCFVVIFWHSIDPSWRTVVYGVLSAGLLAMAERFFVSKFEHRYL